MINRLITFEGIDGSVKSTQIKLLTDWFDNKKINYICLREPGGTTISEDIRRLLLNKGNHQLSIESEVLLFLSARSQLVSEKIIPSLSNKHFVICDRFIDSTVAYQGYGRGMDLESIHIMNNFATCGIMPEITFLLSISTQISRLRRTSKEDDRMESSGLEFLSSVNNGYYELAKENPSRICKIDGSLTTKEISISIKEKMIDKFEELL